MGQRGRNQQILQRFWVSLSNDGRARQDLAHPGVSVDHTVLQVYQPFSERWIGRVVGDHYWWAGDGGFGLILQGLQTREKFGALSGSGKRLGMISSCLEVLLHFVAAIVESLVVRAQSSESYELAVGNVFCDMRGMAGGLMEICMGIGWFCIDVRVQVAVL